MIKGKDVVVHFSKEANEVYTQLQEKVANQRKQGTQNSSDMQLLKSIDREKENLKRDPQSGIHIPRANIPNRPCRGMAQTSYGRLISQVIGE